MEIGHAFVIIAAVPGDLWDTLREVLLLLSLALVLGTLAERLQQSAIVGYLVAGTLAGPNVLGWIDSQERLFRIAELGVALLLFTIGLEFSPRRLANLGKVALGGGFLQVTVTVAIAATIAHVLGLPLTEAIVVGAMIAMSSTVCVLQLLADRAEMDSEHGRISLGVLLVQDVAVVPLVILVAVLREEGTVAAMVWRLGSATILAGLLVAVFYLIFNFIVPRLFDLHVLRRNRDLPVLLATIMAVGSAWASHAAGLSPALGAFLAGGLVGVSPFAVQIRADVQPLKTVMVTLFFAAVGMFGDPVWLMQNWLLVTSVSLAILFGKAAIIAGLVSVLGISIITGVSAGMCLAQVGEFSFVLASVAGGEGSDSLLSGETFRVIISASIVTLLFTPYLIAGAGRFGRWTTEKLASRVAPQKPSTSKSEPATIESRQGRSSGRKAEPAHSLHVIGFGPAGRRVVESLLRRLSKRMIVIDKNRDNVALAHTYGLEALLGDATQIEILEHAHIRQAQAVIITIPDPKAARQIIHQVRSLAPSAFVAARSRYHIFRWELLLAGADIVIDEEDEVGRRLAYMIRRHTRGDRPV